ncbi:MAG: MFS transporter [Gemmatimonadota bacterium]
MTAVHQIRLRQGREPGRLTHYTWLSSYIQGKHDRIGRDAGIGQVVKNRPLAVLFAAVLVDMMGFGIVLPLLPFYAESMAASPLDITVLVASYSAMQLAAAPFWGRVSDKRGRRPLLIAGLFASAFSYLLFGLAESFWWLLLSRMVAGAAGGTITIAQAYVADTTSHEERARGMGHLGAASGLGVMLGPAIGALFSDWGLGAPGFVAAGLCAANGVAAFFLVPESRSAARRQSSGGQAATFSGWARAMTAYPLAILLTVYFLTISSFNAMTAVMALYMERSFSFTAKDMGLLFTLAGGTTVVVRGLLLGTLVKRLGEGVTVRIGIVALMMALLALPALPSGVWAMLIVPGYAFGAGTLFPALASLVSRATDEASQGSILGGSQLVGGLGRVIGPLWAGYAFQHIGITMPFHIGLFCVTIALLIAFRIPAPRVTKPVEMQVVAAGVPADRCYLRRR